MSEKVIKPDLRFVKSVVNSGGDSLKKCYQCATCSVVCNVTPEENPFPRKEMIQAQWGLKEDLFRNPDIWLCHHCSDCTAYCPRGAKPGEVLGAIRKMSLEHYSRPGFLARMVNDPKYLVLLLALPVVIFLLIASGFSSLNFSEIPRGEYGGIVFSNFIPVMTRGEKLAGGLVGSVITTIGEILGHGRFRKCDLTRPRSTSHMLVLFSFIGLAVTTTWALIYLYGLGWDSPYPMTDPLKVLANLSAIALLVGVGLVIANRVNKAEKAGMGSYYDWLFIGVVATIVVTGALSELTRLGNIAGLAYPIYLTHLVAVFFLFAYAPFSKMAHMVYRTTAMVYARTAGRK
ncbi:MAG: 4Fe-4S dicluster domain-containing protein [Nitrospirota bacterium]